MSSTGSADVAQPAQPASPLPSRPDRRLVGVDAARGLALIGMFVVHVLAARDAAGELTLLDRLTSGTSSAAFATLAGVGLALAFGRRNPVPRSELPSAAAGLTVRAVCVLLIGLVLGLVNSGLAVILAYYGVLFVLAIPLVALRARTLAVLVVVVAVGVPVLSHLVRGGLGPPNRANPTLLDLGDPVGLLTTLTLNGYYPALAWSAYLAAGMCAGRLDLAARRVQLLLLTGGALLAAAASGLSALLLGPLGGYREILTVVPGVAGVAELRDSLAGGQFGTVPTTSPWFLAVVSPHSTTPLDMLRTIGTSLALLGLMLLVAGVARRALLPLAAAGGMTLTLYTVHVAWRGTGLLPVDPVASLLLQVVVALVFATGWRALVGRGPLEAGVHRLSGAARSAATPESRGSDRRPVSPDGPGR